MQAGTGLSRRLIQGREQGGGPPVTGAALSAVSEARRPVLVLVHPRSNREEDEDLEERRLNRNGWIVVVVGALLIAMLIGFARRANPDILSHLDQSAFVE